MVRPISRKFGKMIDDLEHVSGVCGCKNFNFINNFLMTVFPSEIYQFTGRSLLIWHNFVEGRDD